MKKELNILSLFSGCGGLDLGFELAENDSRRFKTIWANDILSHACDTFAHNFKAELYSDPEEPIADKPKIYCGDVKKIRFKQAFAGKKVDVILGGFPCQDFSVLRGADSRGGIGVKRGRLYLHYVRALIETQPKFFVAENVKGLVSANKGLAYKKILDDFENLNTCWKDIEKECGYEVEPNGIQGYRIIHNDVVAFSKLGVPQKRERLLIIGLRKDLADAQTAARLRADLKSKIQGSSLFSAFPLTVLECFYGSTIDKLNGEYSKAMKEFKKTIHSINSDRQKEFVKTIWPKYTFSAEKDYLWLNNAPDIGFDTAMKEHKEALLKMGYLNNALEAKKLENGSQEEFSEKDSVKERMKHIPPGENHEFVRDTKHHVTGLMSNIYKRAHPLKPSQTIIACGGGGTWGYHFAFNRQRLTTRERARIQTFPDWFVFKGKQGEIRTQIGNAVPPYGARVVAEKLLEVLKDIT